MSGYLIFSLFPRSGWTDTPERRAKKARGEIEEEQPDEKEELESLLVYQRSE